MAWLVGRLPRSARRRVLAVGVGLDHRCVYCETLAAHQPLGNTARDGLLEQLAEKVAVTEAAVPVLGEGRVVRHRTVQAEPAEPAIRQVEMNLVAQPALRPDAHAIADDQHSAHALRLDRGTAGRSEERRVGNACVSPCRCWGAAYH